MVECFGVLGRVGRGVVQKCSQSLQEQPGVPGQQQEQSLAFNRHHVLWELASTKSLHQFLENL